MRKEVSCKRLSRLGTSVAAVLFLAVGALVAGQGCSPTASRTGGFTPEGEGADASVTGNAGREAGTAPGSDSEAPSFPVDDGSAAGGPLLTPDAACATGRGETQREPVYLLFVVDGSGSMGSGSGKWEAQTAALDAIFDDMLAQKDTSLGVGLIVFSDKNDPTHSNGPYPSSTDVFVGYVNQAQHDALRKRIDTSGPGGTTPTYTALSGGYGELENLVAPAPLPQGGRKVLVLLTDGAPDGGNSEKAQCTDRAKSELAAAAPKGPIETFAVGVGPFPSTDTNDYDPAFLGKLAQAGGTAPAGCDPSSTTLASVCHLQVTPNGNATQVKQEFIDAIDKIRGAVSSCEFNLSLQNGTADPTQINVVFTDGSGKDTIVPQDPSSGWTYDDPTNPHKVILHGAACDALKKDAHGKLSVMLGCKTKTA